MPPAPFSSIQTEVEVDIEEMVSICCMETMYLPRQELLLGQHLNTDASQLKDVCKRGLVYEASCVDLGS
jgi:hypothetical protein